MRTVVGVFIKTKPILCAKIISSEKYQFIDQINGLCVQCFRRLTIFLHNRFYFRRICDANNLANIIHSFPFRRPLVLSATVFYAIDCEK